MPISPLAPQSLPDLPPIPGVRLAAAQAGIRYKNRTDLLLVELAPGTQAAGVFTRSLTASAPVDWCRAALAEGGARALVVNSGNANAFTGKTGEMSVTRVAAEASREMNCAEKHIFMASTGVIGEPLPDHKITGALAQLRGALSEANWEEASRAIMTTDTFPKRATRSASIHGVKVTINGIAKGSGMIAPDMATMLAFLFTDAALPQPVLQALLSDVNERTFNCITVDSDTSTSDTALLFATGQAKNPAVKDVNDPALAEFKAQLHSLMLELAQLIIKDGEGARKFVTVRVTGAESDRAAKRIGLAIGNSPLVKTALAAGDANWGRIVMAVGKAGEKADRDRLSISIGDALIAANGQINPDYIEGPTAEYMKGDNIRIHVDLGIGQGEATIWTCDLTHGYIDINGSYRS